MKELSELFAELGFKKDSNIDTQKAFVRHLISEANQKELPRKRWIKEKMNDRSQQENTSKIGEQLEFKFDTEAS